MPLASGGSPNHCPVVLLRLYVRLRRGFVFVCVQRLDRRRKKYVTATRGRVEARTTSPAATRSLSTSRLIPRAVSIASGAPCFDAAIASSARSCSEGSRFELRLAVMCCGVMGVMPPFYDGFHRLCVRGIEFSQHSQGSGDILFVRVPRNVSTDACSM
jgi:hypothetical protein